MNYRENINKCVGIITEFDPFHNGHQWLIDQVRHRNPDRGVLCVMSGNYTQRGTAAAVHKSARAEMALRGGADLVLEMPVLWAASSAESFARGGIQCLMDTGIVDTVAFGSECGDLTALRSVAETLDDPEVQREMAEQVRRGISFAAARQQAVRCRLGETGELLSCANNNLGVEYLRALRYMGREDIRVITLPRQGAGHDSGEENGAAVSASLIRRWMKEEQWNKVTAALPEGSAAVIEGERERGGCPALLERCELGVLARLRSMTAEELTALPDCGGGLEHRIRRAAQESVTLAEFYDRAKTRCYPEARIRRVALWAFLGLRAEDRPERVPYLRLLGSTGRGRELLHVMKKQASCPILMRNGGVRELDETGKRIFALENRADDLWALCLPRPELRRGGASLRPVRLD